MIKSTVTIGRDLLGIIALTKTAAARMIATKVVAEFDSMLLSAPQYSGNYVANMRLSIGAAARGASETKTYKKYPKRPKRSGVMAPIKRAREANNLDTFEERFVRHALNVPVWNLHINVWNPYTHEDGSEAARYVEDMPEWRMRDPNKPDGLNAMEKFRDRMSRSYVGIQVKVV